MMVSKAAKSRLVGARQDSRALSTVQIKEQMGYIEDDKGHPHPQGPGSLAAQE